MIGIEFIVFSILWILLGVLPCRVLWYIAFKEDPHKWLVVGSAIFGPVAGVTHVIGFISVLWLRVYDKLAE